MPAEIINTNGALQKEPLVDTDTVIIVDDEDIFLNMGKNALSFAYNVEVAKNWGELSYLVATLKTVPACFLIDLNLGKERGFEIMDKLHEINDLSDIPIIIVTGEYVPKIQEEGFEKGAFDFILKPYYPKVMRARVDRAVRMFHLQRNLQKEVDKQTIEAVYQRNLAENMLTHVVDALICTIEAKDYYTKGHSMRVSKYSEILALEIGVSSADAKEIARAGALHDIGKISVPIKILEKEGHLSDNEYEKVKAHTIAGEVILTSVEELGIASDVARHHHEKYGGGGYPDGLKGNEISLPARIVTIADAFDVMTSGRIYQKPLPISEVVNEIRRCSGTQFDPELAEVFIRLVEEGKIGNGR